MRNTTIGILAHVDAGKTTLSESILQHAGAIRTCGRVDHGDAFLDTDPMEKKRGITIYSKLARFETAGRPFTILDTPGHADFSPETERALRVLDAAILVISAADVMSQQGADPQVRLLWKLLHHYQVPAMIFLNKLDQFLTSDLASKEASGESLQSESAAEAEKESEYKAEKVALAGKLLGYLQKDLGQSLVPFDERQLCEDNEESVAVCEDALMERLLEGGAVTDEDVRRLLQEGLLVPVYAGSALRGEGVEALLEGLRRYTGEDNSGTEMLPGSAEKAKSTPMRLAEKEMSSKEISEEPFGALVYKITRENGTRLTWMKITSGSLSIRDSVQQLPAQVTGAGAPYGGGQSSGGASGVSAGGSDLTEAMMGEAYAPDDSDAAEDADCSTDTAPVSEKISELRLYSGDRYQQVTRVEAGEIVAAAGLSYTQAGDGLGIEESRSEELLAPIMSCRVTATDRFGKPVDEFTLMKVLRELEEQEPMLQVAREEETGDLTVRIMGAIQIEILENLLREKYDLRASFGQGSIIYQETIARAVEGVGHFEPLRHYAEVHLALEPGERGSGIVIENHCIPNMLERNWQSLILSQLSSKRFKGVLTGAGLTDVRISLLGGKASKKHTSGGDFRKAAYAAVRQGLMSTENVLLEPVLNVTLEIPAANVGRAMTDISQMHGSCQPAELLDGSAVLQGTVPASELGDYAATVAGYTGGRGRLSATFKGYEPCHNAEEVIAEKAYDPDADRRNPSWSVFCSHGAGTVVTWDHVREMMHVDTEWKPDGNAADGSETEVIGTEAVNGRQKGSANRTNHSNEIDDFKERQQAREREEKELERIFEKTYGPVQHSLRHPDNVRREVQGLVLPSEERAAAGNAGMAGGGGIPKDSTGGAQKASADTKWDSRRRAAAEQQQEFLLVDGYNIIFAWAELKDLAKTDIKSARDRLLDILSDYAGYSGKNVIVVFDAYRVPGGKGEYYRYNNLDVVFTKEAETADLYIEKTAHRLYPKNKVTVATGDYVEQIIIFGAGAVRLSPRGLLEEILFAGNELKDKYVTSD